MSASHDGLSLGQAADAGTRSLVRSETTLLASLPAQMPRRRNPRGAILSIFREIVSSWLKTYFLATPALHTPSEYVKMVVSGGDPTSVGSWRLFLGRNIALSHPRPAF